MTPNLLYLDETCEGSELRLFQMIQHHRRITAHYQDNWESLFKSKKYKKAMKHCETVKDHIVRQVLKMYPTAKWYEVEMIGSMKLLDVQWPRKQRYLVRFKFSKGE